MGVLTSITMAKSFFGEHTEHRHKKHFSFVLTVSMDKNILDPKIGPKKLLVFLSF